MRPRKPTRGWLARSDRVPVRPGGGGGGGRGNDGGVRVLACLSACVGARVRALCDAHPCKITPVLCDLQCVAGLCVLGAGFQWHCRTFSSTRCKKG